MKARVRAHRWHWCLFLCCACGVVTFVFGQDSIELPILLMAVPVPALVGLASLVAALGPLYDTFPSLSRTFAREASTRRVRVFGVLLLAAIGHLPVLLASEAIDVSADITWWLVLLALGIVSVVLVGDFAWLMVLIVGFTSLTLQYSTTIPIAVFLSAVGPLSGVAAVAVAGIVCAQRGPRRQVQA